MKTCKKMLAVLVALCMLISSFALLASANAPTAEEKDAKVVVLTKDDLKAMEIDADDIDGCLLGDYDGDEKVTAEDARLTLRSAVRLENRLPKERMFLVDLDRDRQITSADARLILRMSVGLEVSKTVEIEKPEIAPERYPDEKPITVNKLYQLESDKFVFEALYYDDGMIRAIDGEFTSLKVNSIDDAILVFKQLSPLLGLKDADDYLLSKDDILYSTTGTGDATRHYYRLNPTVNDVPVFGSDMVLIVNNEGTPNGFHSAYNSKINMVSTVPTATASDAEAAAMEAFKDYLSEQIAPTATASDADATATDAVEGDLPGSSDGDADAKLTDEEIDQLIAYISDSVTVESSLVIYDADRSIPELAWDVRIFSSNAADPDDSSLKDAAGLSDANIPLPVFDRTYFVYADGFAAGKVMRSFSNLEGEWEDSIETATDTDAKAYTFNVQVDGTESQLVDAARNIKTYQTLYSVTGGDIGSGAYIKPVLPGRIVTKAAAGWNFKAVGAHSNLGKAYDFYAGLGRKSYDGNEAEIIDSVEYVPYEGTSALTWLQKAFGESNAFWSGNLKQFVFYNAGNNEAALDVVGHEYTHAVTNTIVGGPSLDYTLTYYGESGALNEAYSDILGSLIEGKTKDDTGRWLVGEDTGAAYRNMADPESKGQADNYTDLADSAWKAKLDNYVDRDNEGVHIFSGVFSLAYYKMVTDNDTSCANTAHKHTSRTKYITDSQWATVFYNSLSHLEMNAKFADARMAVINEARAAGFTKRQIQAIKDAFDDVGITGAENVDAGDVIKSTDWIWYEHPDYQFKYMSPQPENRAHSITIDDKDIVMNGFNAEAYKDFLFKHDSDAKVKTFYFELVRDRTDWHSIEGAGFLFNTQIKDNTIEGYCILTTQSGLKLVRINPCNLDDFRDGRYNYVEHAGQLLTTVNIGDPYAVQSYVIRVSATAITVICNGEEVITNYVLPVESASYGYGPIISHASHACYQLSYYTFSNIQMKYSH